ncbi:30S ribosomal protein S15 [Candidatus Proelusimicrobium excrementi]|uniref:30S ribosomal protein S15 n=1 Tax=Candidatus Proelusimicrobium excrementi TaxID=3416222 RepID=UPI003C8B947D|nr:30S ribosomal protein S15 [Elusimicrobiaceae bacterium]MDD6173579.1 30S ribosomal protein S15 [Elusimicrobiota bacterium]
MALTVKDRKDIISKFQQSANDTGSASVQIALITERIQYLTNHLKANPKDFAGERGLVKLVGQRKRLLAYLKKNDFAKYQQLTKELKIRK